MYVHIHMHICIMHVYIHINKNVRHFTFFLNHVTLHHYPQQWHSRSLSCLGATRHFQKGPLSCLNRPKALHFAAPFFLESNKFCLFCTLKKNFIFNFNPSMRSCTQGTFNVALASSLKGQESWGWGFIKEGALTPEICQ